ncbi:hypothetical protein QNI16_19455 [Cytophagaceae bacterium YF14B1]|uniref:Uncharacterized protein n=1 Tax=Xanthocytophaga flava TaxID=3048013 RepID=A0AAE3U7R0_9BACT|nr:hypothetical protein [Xanthocytophaga flavus]MDJ1482686.1 hypothetical protein [Xanthocytophaga flavus]
MLAQKTKQKRAPFPNPSARKAKGQPRGKRIANAPTPTSTIEVILTLFVTPLFLFFLRNVIFFSSKFEMTDVFLRKLSFYPLNPLPVLLKGPRGKTGGISDWRIFFLLQNKQDSICHKILSGGQGEFFYL